MVDLGLSGSVLAVVLGFRCSFWFSFQREREMVAAAKVKLMTLPPPPPQLRCMMENPEQRMETTTLTSSSLVQVLPVPLSRLLLARKGINYHEMKIERDLTEPDRIVGELLQPGGYLKLQELGLEDCVEKIDAQRVFGYALFKDGKSTRLSYPLEKFHSDVAGRSFHNGRFIQRMREKAASLPNVKLEQGTVTSLLEENGTIKGVQYKTKSGEELKAYAPLTVVCDGCFSNLRRTLCDPKVPAQIKDAFIAAINKGNIRTMPNQLMPAAPHPTPGALLMGDAFNIATHLTGGGMTVALSDIVVLRDLLKPLHDLNDAPTLCRYLESFYTLRKPVASTINTLAGALYKVFCASPDQARKEMREACFDYLSLGGVFSEGPVSLLSGLNPRPLSLVCHFFAVAIFGVGRLLLPFPSPKRLWIGARLISIASAIIFPIIKAEGLGRCSSQATVPHIIGLLLKKSRESAEEELQKQLILEVTTSSAVEVLLILVNFEEKQNLFQSISENLHKKPRLSRDYVYQSTSTRLEENGSTIALESIMKDRLDLAKLTQNIKWT
ncbi:Squalene epoxidase 1 [Datura stramonium]|uniref:Squalene monooxygenase n=1 Tax=Datura stramonium TaxID=4076 RepID=A0ABS8VLX6_DATST|nr:Squalene epoxidase 1 [Datura stramonium]